MKLIDISRAIRWQHVQGLLGMPAFVVGPDSMLPHRPALLSNTASCGHGAGRTAAVGVCTASGIRTDRGNLPRIGGGEEKRN
jgi:hypothetical protein